MTMNRMVSDLLDEAENRYELILRVAGLAKRIKEETKELEGTTNPVIQALQEIAAERDGTLLVDTK